MTDARSLTADECGEILALVPGVDLRGWSLDGVKIAGATNAGAVRPVGRPRYVHELADGRRVEVWESRYAWGVPVDLAADVSMRLDVVLQAGGCDIGSFSAKFTRVRDPDLRTLSLLERFLERRLGQEAGQGALLTEYPTRRDQVNIDISAAIEALNASDEFPWHPHPGEEDYDKKREAWSIGLDQKNKRMADAIEAAFSTFEINGRDGQREWELAIEVLYLSGADRELFKNIDDDALRSRMRRVVSDTARRAYVLGRMIREGEILQEIPLVERKKQKDRSDAATRIHQEKADEAWRGQGLEIAKKARRKDPMASQDAIAGEIQSKVAGAPKTTRGVTKEISKWEEGGLLPKRGAVSTQPD